MKGHRVSDDGNVIRTANGWLEDQEQQFFYNGMRTLEKPWTNCRSDLCQGEYRVHICIRSTSKN